MSKRYRRNNGDINDDAFQRAQSVMESHRIWYQVLKTRMNGPAEETKLRRTTIPPQVHIFSVFPNFWDTDSLRRDRVLDFGWCELKPNSLDDIKHFLRISRKTNLAYKEHHHSAEAVSEVMPSSEAMSERLRTLLDGMPSGKGDVNVIFVWNWERTREAFLKSGYQRLDDWREGLPRDLGRATTSRRSASPSARHHVSVTKESSSSHTLMSRSRHRSPNPSTTPFHVVDLVDFQRLCLKNHGFEAQHAYHNELIRVVDMGKQHQLTRREGCCAADDCRILLDIWKRLASGSLVSRKRKNSHKIGLEYFWQASATLNPSGDGIESSGDVSKLAPQPPRRGNESYADDAEVDTGSDYDSDEDDRGRGRGQARAEVQEETAPAKKFVDPQNLDDDSDSGESVHW